MGTEPSSKPCPNCGRALSSAGPSGFCPHCVAVTCLPGGADRSQPTSEISELCGHDILGEIGRGGMGVVYRARHRRLQREVALKLLLAGQFSDDAAMRRFRREAEAAAALDHPNIVTIFEVGEEDGLPWFSMELVRGASLSGELSDQTMPAARAAGIALAVAEALAHAHARGVVHRDLKPDNILLDQAGQPRIVDFGIARLVCDAAHGKSLTMAPLGSPGFTAPEQAFPTGEGGGGEAADLYGIGAVLYFMLTGRPPHQAASLEALLLAVQDDEPLRPRQFAPGIPRDLETICLQCLRKSPADRYPSAAALAEDLRRFLGGHPVAARRRAAHVRLGAWVRRHPAQAIGVAAGLLLAAVITASSLWVTKTHRDLERRSRLVAAARSERSQREGAWRERALAGLGEAWEIRPSEEIRREAAACLALPEIVSLGEFPEPVDPPVASRSRDGKWTARVGDGVIEVVPQVGGEGVATIPVSHGRPLLKLDDHGSRLAVADPRDGRVRLLRVPDGSEICSLAHPQPLHSLDWAGDLIAAACTDRFVYIWGDDGTLRHRLAGHEGDLLIARFRPRGQELVTLANDKWLRVWHAARGEEIARLQCATEHRLPAWFDADGSTLHVASREGLETRFSLRWSPCLELLAPGADEPHPENRGTIALHPDGNLVATVDEHACRLRDFATGELLASIPKGSGEWMHVRFSPAGDRLWLCGWDEGLRSVRLPPLPGTVSSPQFGAGYLLHDLSADGRFAVLANTSERSPEVSVFDLQTATRTTRVAQTNCLAAAISPDAKWLITSAYDQPGAALWALPDGGLQRHFATGGLVVHVLFSPDGQTVILATEDGNFRTIVGQWGRLEAIGGGPRMHSPVWSPRGDVIACTDGGRVVLLDATTLALGKELAMPEHAGWLGNAHLAFDASGRFLAVHTTLGTVARWDLDLVGRESPASWPK